MIRLFSKRQEKLATFTEVPQVSIDDTILNHSPCHALSPLPDNAQDCHENFPPFSPAEEQYGALLDEYPPHFFYLFPSTFIKCFDQDDECTIEVMPPPSQRFSHYLLPPPKSNKQCLVVDLDETLIHCLFMVPDNSIPFDHTFSLEVDGDLKKVYLYCRPHLQEFLQFISQRYECVLFTASIERVG